MRQRLLFGVIMSLKNTKTPAILQEENPLRNYPSVFFLTDLIITCPIGIPMIVHSTTKLKNRGYYERKVKFEEGLAEAEKITDPVEKQKYYDRLIKDCKLDINRKYKKDQKESKKAAKEAKKQEKAVVSEDSSKDTEINKENKENIKNNE